MHNTLNFQVHWFKILPLLELAIYQRCSELIRSGHVLCQIKKPESAKLIKCNWGQAGGYMDEPSMSALSAGYIMSAFPQPHLPPLSAMSAFALPPLPFPRQFCEHI